MAKGKRKRDTKRTNKGRESVFFCVFCGISRFFSANLEVSRFPDFTCGNPGFLFRFGRLTLLHGPCHQAHQAWAKNKFYDRLNHPDLRWRQAHQAWAKNKFYDRLNPLHNATQGYPRLTMAPASHA